MIKQIYEYKISNLKEYKHSPPRHTGTNTSKGQSKKIIFIKTIEKTLNFTSLPKVHDSVNCPSYNIMAKLPYKAQLHKLQLRSKMIKLNRNYFHKKVIDHITCFTAPSQK